MTGITPSHDVLRVGMVDDHPLFLDLLASALNEVPNIEVVATANGAHEAKKWFDVSTMDVVILDVELTDGNGVGLGAQFRRQNPDLGVVLLSDLDVIETVDALPEEIRQGWCYVTKVSTKSIEFLTKVLIAATKGETIIDQSFANRSVAVPGSKLQRLSPRQFEVLRAVSRGDSNQEIATSLGIAVNSVANHLIAIYDALEIDNKKNSRVVAAMEFVNGSTKAAEKPLSFS